MECANEFCSDWLLYILPYSKNSQDKNITYNLKVNGWDSTAAGRTYGYMYMCWFGDITFVILFLE